MNRSYSKIRHIQEANHKLEKRLVENVITEGDVNEQLPPALTGLAKSASKKIGQYVDDAVNYFKKPAKTPKYFDEIPGYKPKTVSVPKNVPPSLGNSLSKYGEQTWDQALNRALQPVRDEVVVLTNDLRRLTPQIQDKKLLTSVEATLDYLTNPNMGGSLTMSKGTYDFYKSFEYLAHLKELIDEVIATQKVTPDGLKILQYMKGNLDDASQKLQTAFLDTLRK
jgi:hypothetical protein